MDVVGGILFDDIPAPRASLAASAPANDMPEYTITRITNTTDKDGNTQRFTDVITEQWTPEDLATKRSLDYPAPVYITGPGAYAIDNIGSLLSLDANGNIYRDGKQLAGVAARQFCVVGRALYAQGKTLPQWWTWNGSGWTGPILNGDPNILK